MVAAGDLTRREPPSRDADDDLHTERWLGTALQHRFRPLTATRRQDLSLRPPGPSRSDPGAPRGIHRAIHVLSTGDCCAPVPIPPLAVELQKGANATDSDKGGQVAAPESVRLAGDAVPVCVQPVVVVSDYNDATGVQRPVAAAPQAVVVEGICPETRVLIAGVAGRCRFRCRFRCRRRWRRRWRWRCRFRCRPRIALGDDHCHGAPMATAPVGPPDPARTAAFAAIRESSAPNLHMTRHAGGCVEARSGCSGEGTRRRDVGLDLDPPPVVGCAVCTARAGLGGGRSSDGERSDDGGDQKAFHAIRTFHVTRNL